MLKINECKHATPVQRVCLQYSTAGRQAAACQHRSRDGRLSDIGIRLCDPLETVV